MVQVNEQLVMDSLKQCMDPEVPLSVVDLVLIYGVDINDRKDVNIRMTMTTHGCPLHDTLVSGVKRYENFKHGRRILKIRSVEDAGHAEPSLVTRKQESGKIVEGS